MLVLALGNNELEAVAAAFPQALDPVGEGQGGRLARVRWFRTFAMNVSQIYDGDGDPVEMKIDLDKEAAN
jgi:hypothetical protein